MIKYGDFKAFADWLKTHKDMNFAAFPKSYQNAPFIPTNCSILTSYLIFSPFLAFLSCSSADFLPTFSFFSLLERDLAKPQASLPSSEEEEERLTQ